MESTTLYQQNRIFVLPIQCVVRYSCVCICSDPPQRSVLAQSLSSVLAHLFPNRVTCSHKCTTRVRAIALFHPHSAEHARDALDGPPAGVRTHNTRAFVSHVSSSSSQRAHTRVPDRPAQTIDTHASRRSRCTQRQSN